MSEKDDMSEKARNFPILGALDSAIKARDYKEYEKYSYEEIQELKTRLRDKDELRDFMRNLDSINRLENDKIAFVEVFSDKKIAKNSEAIASEKLDSEIKKLLKKSKKGKLTREEKLKLGLLSIARKEFTESQKSQKGSQKVSYTGLWDSFKEIVKEALKETYEEQKKEFKANAIRDENGEIDYGKTIDDFVYKNTSKEFQKSYKKTGKAIDNAAKVWDDAYKKAGPDGEIDYYETFKKSYNAYKRTGLDEKTAFQETLKEIKKVYDVVKWPIRTARLISTLGLDPTVYAEILAEMGIAAVIEAGIDAAIDNAPDLIVGAAQYAVDNADQLPGAIAKGAKYAADNADQIADKAVKGTASAAKKGAQYVAEHKGEIALELGHNSLRPALQNLTPVIYNLSKKLNNGEKIDKKAFMKEILNAAGKTVAEAGTETIIEDGVRWKMFIKGQNELVKMQQSYDATAQKFSGTPFESIVTILGRSDKIPEYKELGDKMREVLSFLVKGTQALIAHPKNVKELEILTNMYIKNGNEVAQNFYDNMTNEEQWKLYNMLSELRAQGTDKSRQKELTLEINRLLRKVANRK